MTLVEFSQYLNVLSRFIRARPKACIIARDFNAQSSLWRSQREDRKGKMVRDWIAEHGLVLHNKGNRPTFNRNGAVSFIHRP